MSYHQRTLQAQHPTLKKLFSIIDAKKTNLAIAADVYTQRALIELIDEVGPHICMLKLHIDCISDFDNTLPEKLKQKAQEYNFLICEDRKFADIGSTVRAQLTGGIYRIASWADIIIVHATSGPGILDAIRSSNCGVLLIAELSSKGNLIDENYTQRVLEMMRGNSDVVIGVIGQKCAVGESFIKVTPGVNLKYKGDTLGQQYNAPETVIARGTDVIIVGRGIYQARSKKEAAQMYQKAGWYAYQKYVDHPV